jgi:hypothetical protein
MNNNVLVSETLNFVQAETVDQLPTTAVRNEV